MKCVGVGRLVPVESCRRVSTVTLDDGLVAEVRRHRHRRGLGRVAAAAVVARLLFGDGLRVKSRHCVHWLLPPMALSVATGHIAGACARRRSARHSGWWAFTGCGGTSLTDWLTENRGKSVRTTGTNSFFKLKAEQLVALLLLFLSREQWSDNNNDHIFLL